MLAAFLGLFLAVSARADVEEPPDCREGVGSFAAEPKADLFFALVPCLEDPDKEVRALAFDKLAHRVAWDDPRFNPLFAKLDKLAAVNQNDPDFRLRSKASDFRWWLRNSRQWESEKAAKAEAKEKAARSDLADATERDRVRLSLLFGAGVVAQTLVMVLGRGPVKPLYFGAAAVFGLFGLVPGKHERIYEPHFHIAYCFVIYAFMLFSFYKKEIMARVSESSLLVNSLTFWYLAVTFLGGFQRSLVLALAALPTLGTLVVAFTIREWSFKSKLACYAWFLVLAVANSCFLVGFGNLSFLFAGSYAAPAPWDLFMTGMAFAGLLASLFFVFVLLPTKSKDETEEQSKRRWQEDAHEMASRFSDYQLKPAEAAQIVVLQLGFYAANHYARWFLPGSMLNLSIVALPLVFDGLLSLRRQGGAAAAFAEPPL